MLKTIATQVPMKRTVRARLIKNIQTNMFGYLLMLPSIVLTFIFSYLPMPGLLSAFQDYNMFAGLWKSDWVGLVHFKEIFEIPLLWGSIINTLKLSVLTIIVGFPAPILLALMINELKNGLYKRSVQTLTYLPHFLSWIAVVGLCYSFFDSYGPLNDLRVAMFGPETEREMYLSQQGLFLPLLLLLSVWKEVGWGTIVYLATITSIDPHLYEAAKMDGANRFKQHLHITLPGLKQTTILLLLFTLGTLFASNFELVYGMQNAFINFDVIATVIFSSGIQQGSYSLATAVGFAQGLVALLLIIIANKIAKKISGVSIW
ncbi:sugar ABC transporter permease [Paenibacillus sp. CF384]|uniref:ABC transporter permease n=1 Tax=Paenibacillus sp. CF384 TaxID=1884382 RepID=UPI00089C4688|nr:ABC transporter permease subunit [Paenibacillus sp. CF384]SDX37859.1 putative aldouronate transport system permease protein [Paenibacillus sp. CF384]